MAGTSRRLRQILDQAQAHIIRTGAAPRTASDQGSAAQAGAEGLAPRLPLFPIAPTPFVTLLAEAS